MAFDLGNYLERSANALRDMIAGRDAEKFAGIAELMSTSLKAGNKVLLCGNGGSAADAQHLTGELVGRFYRDRPGLPAISLTTDASVVTAAANDYGYEQVFSRQLAALGRPGDVLWALTTSGNSANVLRAVETAVLQEMSVVLFTGAGGGAAHQVIGDASLDNGAKRLWYRAPSDETPIVQQCHLIAGHAVCALVEELLFPC